MKILIALNTSWNVVNFRSGLIRALIAQGHEVTVVAPPDDYSPLVPTLGCTYVPLPMDNKGTHPGRDALLLFRLVRLLRQHHPDAVLAFTVKPNVYASIAARALGIPVINNIAGLGAVFIKGGWLSHLVQWLYRTALKKSFVVFFQNADDRQLFITNGLVNEASTRLLPGSGVDLQRFTPVPLPQKSPIRFLLIARMLRDKGVVEFVNAAARLKALNIDAEFCLLGFLDVKNPQAISRTEVETWVAQGYVKYLGVNDDVRSEIARADCVVLPSYREGTPRALLEAAAMGRPLITTDAVGCREVVDDGVNGFLCRVCDVDDLSDKLVRMAKLSPSERTSMGLKGRAKMEHQFSEERVVSSYQQALHALSNMHAEPLSQSSLR